MQKPTHTPWGASEVSTPYGDGLIFHSTRSHGGFYVPPALLAKMPREIIEATFGGLGRTGWFEEDADAHLVVAWFRERFDQQQINTALNALRLELAYWEQRARTTPFYEGRYRARLAAMNAIRKAQGATAPQVAPAGWEVADTSVGAA